MADARELVAPVPIRCCARGNDLAPMKICGEGARWMRPGRDALAAYFCDVHRESTDIAIPDVAIVRRISVVAEVVFNGALTGRMAAEAEAVIRLQDAVAGAGGAMSLVSVDSDMGRQPVPAPPGATKTGRAGG